MKDSEKTAKAESMMERRCYSCEHYDNLEPNWCVLHAKPVDSGFWCRDWEDINEEEGKEGEVIHDVCNCKNCPSNCESGSVVDEEIISEIEETHDEFLIHGDILYGRERTETGDCRGCAFKNDIICELCEPLEDPDLESELLELCDDYIWVEVESLVDEPRLAFCQEDNYVDIPENADSWEALDPKSSYYDAGGIEVIDIIRAKLTPEQYEGFLIGNCIKYSTRANWKGSKERDLEKVNVYSDLLKEFYGE